MIKPILFNTEMVRGILDDRKTVTRRIISDPYHIQGDENDKRTIIAVRTAPKGSKLYREIGEMPYPDSSYKIGDILYVRETWGVMRAKRYDAIVDIKYKAGGENKTICFSYGGTDNANRYEYDNFVKKWASAEGILWHPSIHMPKEAARIFLRVTDVRVERLQDITIEGIRAEGLTSAAVHAGDMEIAIQEWTILWDSTIKKADLPLYGWYANPWVWVIEFERCKKPEGK